MENNIEKLEKYLTYAVAFLVPIAVLPIFPNAFITIKLIILTLGVASLLALKATRMIISGKLDLAVSKFDFAVLLIAGSYIASTILRTPNKMEALFLPGTATIFAVSALFYFLVNQLRDKEKDVLTMFLYASGIVTALVSIVAVTGITSKLPLPDTYAFIKNVAFTTLGGNLPAAIFLGAIIPLGLHHILNEKESVMRAFWTVSLSVISLGLLANVYNLVPGKETSPQFVSPMLSWSIAVDAMKVSPLIGVGPANYLTAFNIYRPLEYNNTDLWAVRFTQARNLYLSVLTEAGIIGLAGFIIVAIVLYRNLQTDMKERKLVGWSTTSNMKLVSLAVIMVAFLFFASTPELIMLFFILLSLNTSTSKVVLNLSVTQDITSKNASIAARIPAILVAVPVAALIIVYAFFGAKWVSAEYTFGKSLFSLTQNDGTKTYDLMLSAINQNPSVDRYHASFSQVNFALANSISQKPEGEDLTEEERATVTQLIQQSIEEAKATVALNPTRSSNWKLLADTYRAIIPFAEGADQFAIESYSQAIALDPTNPNLRLDLGGVYYSLKMYPEAVEAFRLAVVSKPDLANAHYNLAVALREGGNFQAAAEQMSLVLSLVERDSSDYEIAKKELEAIEAKIPAKEATEDGTTQQGQELTPPPSAQEPAIEPPIELPEEAAPPAAPENEPGQDTPATTPLP